MGGGLEQRRVSCDEYCSFLEIHWPCRLNWWLVSTSLWPLTWHWFWLPLQQLHQEHPGGPLSLPTQPSQACCLHCPGQTGLLLGSLQEEEKLLEVAQADPICCGAWENVRNLQFLPAATLSSLILTLDNIGAHFLYIVKVLSRRDVKFWSHEGGNVGENLNICNSVFHIKPNLFYLFKIGYPTFLAQLWWPRQLTETML